MFCCVARFASFWSLAKLAHFREPLACYSETLARIQLSRDVKLNWTPTVDASSCKKNNNNSCIKGLKNSISERFSHPDLHVILQRLINRFYSDSFGKALWFIFGGGAFPHVLTFRLMGGTFKSHWGEVVLRFDLNKHWTCWRPPARLS